MKKINIILLFFISFLNVVNGQAGPCYRFADTVLFEGNLLSISVEGCCCECTTVYCLVKNEKQKDKTVFAIAAAFNGIKDGYGDSLLVVISQLNACQFALMKKYIEDTLSSHFTQQDIIESIVKGISLNDTTDYRNFDLLPVPLNEKSIGHLYFKGNDYGTNYLYDNFPVIEREESFVIDKTTLCLKTSHYKSWGIIAELYDCDFFGYEVGERLLYDANYGTIRVFIPLSCHKTDCEKKNPKEHINKKEL